MLSVVLGRFARIVIMNRTVVPMMMAVSFQMICFVGKVECTYRWRPSPLQREAMQGQQQHKKKANEAAHGTIR